MIIVGEICNLLLLIKQGESNEILCCYNIWMQYSWFEFSGIVNCMKRVKFRNKYNDWDKTFDLKSLVDKSDNFTKLLKFIVIYVMRLSSRGHSVLSSQY